ncbi:CvpA family protein, partial [Streptococcus pyogenes]
FLQNYLHSSFLVLLVIELHQPLIIIIKKLWIQAII